MKQLTVVKNNGVIVIASGYYTFYNVSLLSTLSLCNAHLHHHIVSTAHSCALYYILMLGSTLSNFPLSNQQSTNFVAP